VSKKVKPTIVSPAAGSSLAVVAAREAAKTGRDKTTKKAVAKEQTGVTPFKPLRRPPIAMLTLLDDGTSEGEVFRLREARTVIGREDADIRIPHDPLISSKHLEITRRAEGNTWRWFVKDLGSRNGTFFRVSKCRVRNQFEFLMGNCRYRLNVPDETAAEPEGEREDVGTQGWSAISRETLALLSPHLVRFEGETEASSYPLSDEIVIGSDSSLSKITVEDSLLNPEHARLIRQPNGMWKIEDLGSRNGTWMRIEESAVARACQFQLGEQRFVLRVS
tara:strand:+ start:65192 stop:66022 length:831 start_codon:yes stop_codon:yes gene_type:complete